MLFVLSYFGHKGPFDSVVNGENFTERMLREQAEKKASELANEEN